MAEGNAGYTDGYFSLGSTAKGFAIPDGTVAIRAFVTVETAAARYRYSGNAPNAGVGGGHIINAGEEVVIEGPQNVTKFRIVANTGTNADVFYTLESV